MPQAKLSTRRTGAGTTCLEGGPVHARQSTGLDVVRGKLCSTKRCVWCGRTWATPYGKPSRAAVLRAGR